MQSHILAPDLLSTYSFVDDFWQIKQDLVCVKNVKKARSGKRQKTPIRAGGYWFGLEHGIFL